MTSNLKLLVKFPTRSRPEKFLSVLSEMFSLCKNHDNIEVLVSIDRDDETMTTEVIDKAIAITRNISFQIGTSKSKVEAINRDMNLAGDWDVVLLASDDMVPRFQGWDEIITSNMNMYFPDTDGFLWFHDGHQHRICTLTIMGRKYYERFNYLYHPSYVSLWCDNEQTDVAIQLNKCKHFPDTILFRHEHPAWDRTKGMDALYERNEAFFKRDELNYYKRKEINFDL